MNFPLPSCFSLFSIISLLLSCISCGPARPSFEKNVVHEGDDVCSIALLPFINDSRFDQGGVIVQRIMGAKLSSAGIKVASEGDVWNLYRELRIFPNQHPDIEQIMVIGSRLDVQLIITGRIAEMEEKMGDNYVTPVLALTLEVHDAKSGKTMWTTYHRREGADYRTVMHFGLVNTVTQLSRIMAEEVIEEWYAKGMKRCEE